MSLTVVVSFFAIALLYSAAGFGGGSSYLAILALTSVDYLVLRPIALVCNLAVVSGSIAVHARSGNLQLRRVIPFVVFSVPAAFVGGAIRLEQNAYFVVLGSALIAAGLAIAARLVGAPNQSAVADADTTRAYGPAALEERADGRGLAKMSAAAIGAAVGLLSGLVGIGGGVFLAPVLYLIRWGEPRRIAATTSLFIAVNSAAGLAGQIVVGLPTEELGANAVWIGLLVAGVVGGGQIGSRLAARRLHPAVISAVTAGLVIFVGVRLLVANL